MYRQLRIPETVTCKVEKRKTKPKLIEKNKHIIIDLDSFKRFCFARPLLPFGTVWKAYAHCTHLQIAQANALTKICKRVQFYPSLNIGFKIFFTLVSLKLSSNFIVNLIQHKTDRDASIINMRFELITF